MKKGSFKPVSTEPQKALTCKEIVAEYIKKNGYDGLCDEGFPCSCNLKDFMPCGAPGILICLPGYRHSDGLIHLEPEKK